MTIAFSCVKCGYKNEVDGSQAGKKCRCQICGHAFYLPIPSRPIARKPAPGRPVEPPPRTTPASRPERISEPPPPDLYGFDEPPSLPPRVSSPTIPEPSEEPQAPLRPRRAPAARREKTSGRSETAFGPGGIFATIMLVLGVIMLVLRITKGVLTLGRMTSYLDSSPARNGIAAAPPVPGAAGQGAAAGSSTPGTPPGGPAVAAPAAARPPAAQQNTSRITLSNGKATSGGIGPFSPGVTFQVDYKAEGGRIFPGRDRYYWVIKTRRGLASDPMPLRLNGEGTLSGSATLLTRDDAPFESYIEERPMGPFGAKHKASNTIGLSWVDPPAPSPATQRPGNPGIPRPPFGRRR